MIRTITFLLLMGIFMTLCAKTDEYRTTDYNSRLMNNPNATSDSDMLCRIPKGTKLKIIESKDVVQGMMKNRWYKVKYNGKTGWVSGWNMSEPEELHVMTVEERKVEVEKLLDWDKVYFDIKEDIRKRWAGETVKFVQVKSAYQVNTYWIVYATYRTAGRYIEEKYWIKEDGTIHKYEYRENY